MSNEMIKIKRTDYSVLSNDVFRDKGLSYKAKGLLCQMFSLPDGWKFSIRGLSILSSDREQSVRSGLDELKDKGYLNVVCIRDPKGRVSEWRNPTCGQVCTI